MTVYFHEGEWEVASSGRPDASGSRHGAGGNFRDLFWDTWDGLGYARPDSLDFCYMFELITPENKIIVQYNSARIVLHGCRNLRTLEEHAPGPIAEKNGWEPVKAFAYGSADELLEAASHIDPRDGEGFIVCDADFRRLKVKTPKYVQLNRMRDGVSPRAFLAMIRENETAEFLAYFPEYAEDLERLRAQLRAFTAEIGEAYESLRQIPEQREFAEKAGRFRFSRSLFMLRSGKAASAREVVETMPAKNLHRLLGL